MKKVISLAVVLIMVFSFAGCSLFSDSTLVKFDDTHSHSDPADLSYDERIVLKNDKFVELLEEYASSEAYPDLMMYDKEGNFVGMYDYDQSTGLAKGWTNMESGEYTAFEEGKEVDLGKPDESKLVDIPGDVIAGAVVYGFEKKTVSAYTYLFLSDATAKDTVLELMSNLFGYEFAADSDTVLKCVYDEKSIETEFNAAADSGYTFESKDAKAFAEILKGNFSLREYTGENPFKPFEGYTEPEDFEFDQKVVLAGSGEYAVLEEYVQNLKCMTDVLYAKEGEMVGHYTYFEGNTKEDGDALEAHIKETYGNAVRVSDTVVETSLTGKKLADTIESYKGYSVLKDNTIEDYARMIEESFFSVVCE